MIVNSRQKVIWIGGPIPRDLETVTAILGLHTAIAEADQVPSAATDLFAVLVSADAMHRPKAHGRVLRLLSSGLLDYGTLLVIICSDTGYAVNLQSNIIRGIATAPHKPDPTGSGELISNELRGLTADRIGIARPTVEGFASVLRAHDPGPAAEPSLQIDRSASKNAIRAADLILLRRAFGDFTRIVLADQAGGRSEDCFVWRVAAFKGDCQCEPFIAKAARRMTLDVEYKTYQDFVRENIAFPFRAPLVESRRVVGATRAMLVSMFVGRAERLDSYLARASHPELVVSSLFSVSLDGCRSTMRRASGTSIGRIYVDRQRNAARPPQDHYDEIPIPELLPDPATLFSSFKRANVSPKGLPDPAALWQRISSIKPFDYRECLAHGDLNIRNVFVRGNAVDTVLIDFSHAGQYHPMARDLAKLETSIAILATDRKNREFSLRFLQQLYRRPLLRPFDVDATDGRGAAIRQIRRHACGEEISTAEYEILVAFHLLRFASRPVSDTNPERAIERRRALCYRLACELIDF